MIQLYPAPSGANTLFSLDHHIESMAVGELRIFKVVSDGHPRVSVGDVLILDGADIAKCDEKELGNYILDSLK